MPLDTGGSGRFRPQAGALGPARQRRLRRHWLMHLCAIEEAPL
jgi:hypothetical protein